MKVALATTFDPGPLRRPPLRVLVGLGLIALSYVLGWPAVAVFAALAAWLKKPWLVAGGPIFYGLSWLVFVAGVALMGKDSLSMGRALGLMLVRRLAERFLMPRG